VIERKKKRKEKRIKIRLLEQLRCPPPTLSCAASPKTNVDGISLFCSRCRTSRVRREERKGKEKERGKRKGGGRSFITAQCSPLSLRREREKRVGRCSYALSRHRIDMGILPADIDKKGEGEKKRKKKRKNAVTTSVLEFVHPPFPPHPDEENIYVALLNGQEKKKKKKKEHTPTRRFPHCVPRYENTTPLTDQSKGKGSPSRSICAQRAFVRGSTHHAGRKEKKEGRPPGHCLRFLALA